MKKLFLSLTSSLPPFTESVSSLSGTDFNSLWLCLFSVVSRCSSKTVKENPNLKINVHVFVVTRWTDHCVKSVQMRENTDQNFHAMET